MEKKLLLLVVLFGYVKAEDSVACCPSGVDILYKGKNSYLCINKTSFETLPLRFQCDTIISKLHFKVIDGKVKLVNETFVPLLPPELACTGNLTFKRNESLTRPYPIALLCHNKSNDVEPRQYVDEESLGYCLIVSVIFLALTAIIYSLLKELRDLFGKSIINFCTALAIGMGIMSIMKIMVYTDMNMCAVRGFLAYFFVLAAFFWSNSISIQVLRETRRPCTVDYGWHEFRWFMLYSWGVPTALTVCMAIVNYHPGDHDRPGIGLNHCWFFTKRQQWYYMYSVLSILLLINIAIFVYISTLIWRHHFSSSHINALKFKFSMTLRLIVVMGLPWIFEMISSLSEAHILLSIMDVFNSIQGLLLFLILVVLRKRVIKVMYKRGWLSCCSGLIEKYLAVGDDAEEDVIQHTDVPMNDNRT